MSRTLNETTAQLPQGMDIARGDRHRLLASERRRLALDVLSNGAPIGLETLATRVAAEEVGDEAFDQQYVENVTISLYHVHLPLLETCGAIEFDRETRSVRWD